MNIYLINKSTVISSSDLQSWLPAFNLYIKHVRNYWPRSANLIMVDPSLEPVEAWKVIIQDNLDVADALGYHDFTPNGRPISYIGAKIDLDNGYSPTVTITHEIAEMIADPWISELFQVSYTYNYAKEICDPVEADGLGRAIVVLGFPDVLVSDFVLPNWFIPGSTGKYDYFGHITKPLQLLPGGYMSVQKAGSWSQIYADKETGEVKPATDTNAKNKNGLGRLERYARPRGKIELGL